MIAQWFKSTDCAYREPEFSSQPTLGCSKPSVTIVTGDLMPPCGLCGHHA